MPRQPRTLQTDDEPATMPVVVNPLTEESGATWERWSEDREERDRAARIRVNGIPSGSL